MAEEGAYTINPGGSYLETSPLLDAMPLGERKIKLTDIEFDYCAPDGQVLHSHTENCCMANFALTEPYVMQKGTVTTKSSLQIAGTVDINDFEAMDGQRIVDAYPGLVVYDLVEASDYDGGQPVDVLIDQFVDKYSALAVAAGQLPDGTQVAKVPGKDIYVFR